MEVFIDVLLFFFLLCFSTPTVQNIVILIYREKLTEKYELVVSKLRYKEYSLHLRYLLILTCLSMGLCLFVSPGVLGALSSPSRQQGHTSLHHSSQRSVWHHR